MFDLENGTQVSIAGTRPAVWSQDSRKVYLPDATFTGLAYAYGIVEPDAALNRALGKALKSGRAIDSPELFTVAHGLIAVADLTAQIPCEARLSRGTRRVVAQSKNDPNSPLDRIKAFLDLQGKAAKFELSCNACGPAPLALTALDQASRTRVADGTLDVITGSKAVCAGSHCRNS